MTHYAEFEAGGADLGARTTWSSPEAFGGMLSGLLTEGSLQPRSVWWAHKFYADGVATRVASSVSGPHIVALASSASETAFPQVLVGHVDFDKSYTREPASLNAQLALNSITSMPLFNGVRRVNVRIESIPDTGEAALSAPSLLSTTAANVYDGTVQITLPPIAVGAVLRVTLTPRDDGYPDPPKPSRRAPSTTRCRCSGRGPRSVPLRPVISSRWERRRAASCWLRFLSAT